MLADASIRDELVDRITQAVTAFEADAVGGKRIVNRRHFDRLAGALAVTTGEVVIGGGSDAEALEIDATVVLDPRARRTADDRRDLRPHPAHHHRTKPL